jgi:galactokinase/mevalonate kinase-like predicted kinase
MGKCGWDASAQAFRGGAAGGYELYSQMGLALGREPVERDAEVNALSCAVVPMPRAEFYHFGTSRQLIESITALQNLELDEMKLGLMGARRHPNQYLQNSRFSFPLRQEENHTLWVENSTVPRTWSMASEHVLTGVPENEWDVRLERGVCLDFVPVGAQEFCVRCYGIDDAFRGAIGDATTKWFDRPAPNWFFARGVSREAAGIDGRCDIQSAALFPVLRAEEMDARFLEWLFAAKPVRNDEFAKRWLAARRLSADRICEEVSLARVYAQRRKNRQSCLMPMFRNARWSVFYKLDLESTAREFAASGEELPAEDAANARGLDAMQRVHDRMFRGAVLRHRGQAGADAHERGAFELLHEMIVREAQLSPALPRRAAQEDQIVCGRSPVRLDLAGGWSDTPPYCLEHGGKVVNLAVDLNGQPPIQVFAKLIERPELVLRSIDLGSEERVSSYEQLDSFGRPDTEFALAKAALALAGFLPRFHAGGGFRSLEEQLREFGGGIEVSMLSAVPKGSGLGTSSILAATLLATLGDVCGLGWNRDVLFSRTLALEQMLTTGGGWQDQAGAIFRGVKLIETEPGLEQRPTLRWLPEHLFDAEHANRTMLLYYTGITRLAKNILYEIVRGIFLNSPAHLRVIGEIAANAESAFQAIQRCDRASLVEAVANSWQLNQRLDSGTNPPAVQGILDSVGDYLGACKLLGAGGGGYLLMLAKDEGAAERVRQTLTANPPNARARFVQFGVSATGLQLTRS